MRFDVLTLFPQMIEAVVNESILGRAKENGLINVKCTNIRDFSSNKHRKVDDYPYGGGSGMVMSSQPICDAYNEVVKSLSPKPYCVYLSPQGKTFTQETAKRLKDFGHIVLICGHYEGIDERVIEKIVDEEISIGDFVLTGGELPALMIIDAVSRLVPGVLGAEDGYSEESFYNGLLEYPQYTRPENYENLVVPEVLLNGHHEKIRIWRRKESLERTFNKRLDLFLSHNFSDEDIKILINEIPEAKMMLLEKRLDLIDRIKTIEIAILKKNSKRKRKK